jgi:hypothetical protein
MMEQMFRQPQGFMGETRRKSAPGARTRTGVEPRGPVDSPFVVIDAYELAGTQKNAWASTHRESMTTIGTVTEG